MNFYIRDAQPGVTCAVGAALPEENARRAVYPASNNLDEVMTLSDPLTIDQIQDLHDAWALAVHDNDPNAPVKEARFLEECHKHIPATPAP